VKGKLRLLKFMKIGGLQKFSLLDYPEHLSAIIFTTGCNFRCQYCYNPMLVWPEKSNEHQNIDSIENGNNKFLIDEIEEVNSEISEDDLFDFLKNRIGKLEGIVITGGEPTIHHNLPEFIKKIRDLGFKIKLDTNGTNPEMIKNLINKKNIDYIAMDVKGTGESYSKVTGISVDLEKIKKSIKIIMNSSLPYEFRTTIVPELIKINDISLMGKMINGADKWFLQQFKSDIELVNSDFENFSPYKIDVLESMKKEALKFVKNCEIR